MVKYAKDQDGAALEPAELSQRLTGVLRAAMPWLLTISEGEASVPEREAKWSAKQVIGHLTDSAVNNLGRFVKLQIEPGGSLPGYAQMEWVSLQHYGEREWAEVLGLWFALNEHVAWMVAHMERAKLANRGVVEGEPVTLGFVIIGFTPIPIASMPERHQPRPRPQRAPAEQIEVQAAPRADRNVRPTLREADRNFCPSLREADRNFCRTWEKAPIMATVGQTFLSASI